MRSLLLTLVFLLPQVAGAAVVISEVAWMGSSASANHEWIELHNTGSAAVDITGWNLTDGMNLSIELSGTVSAGGYAVLERTSEDAAPGTAFLLYTGALVNTGATLKLTRGDGGLEDQVAGGEGWQSIGGDNTSKETAQYTTAGWVTGTPTPGAANAGAPKTEEDDDEEEEDDTDDDTPPVATARTHSSGETVRLILPDVTLKLIVDAQKVGYVNQPIEFSVEPSGVGDSITDSLTYQWNFGDGGTAITKEPTYAFSYPGTYVVTVHGFYKRQEQVTRHEITILPVALSLTKNEFGDTQLNNDSPYEIDISGYRVEGEKPFVFPAYSILLPNQTITLSKKMVGRASIVVRDVSGVVVGTPTVTRSNVAAKDESTPVSRIVSAVEAAEIEDVPTEILSELWRPPLVLPTAPPTPQVAGTSTEATVIKQTAAPTSTTPSSFPSSAWPYLGLIGVIILGLFGTAKKFTSNQNL